eukprot:3937004-Rhodomonas_salina.2
MVLVVLVAAAVGIPRNFSESALYKQPEANAKTFDSEVIRDFHRFRVDFPATFQKKAAYPGIFHTNRARKQDRKEGGKESPPPDELCSSAIGDFRCVRRATSL